MYFFLLCLHSLVRWGVAGSLLYAVCRGIMGWSRGAVFTKQDNVVRHVTATMAHIQLAIGYMLYFNSPLVAYFRSHYQEAIRQFDFLFFGLIHVALMTIAVVCITIGSSVAKRQDTDAARFRTMTIWFSLALIIIFIAVPWPFSPLANRPYIRPF